MEKKQATISSLAEGFSIVISVDRDFENSNSDRKQKTMRRSWVWTESDWSHADSFTQQGHCSSMKAKLQFSIKTIFK